MNHRLVTKDDGDFVSKIALSGRTVDAEKIVVD